MTSLAAGFASAILLIPNFTLLLSQCEYQCFKILEGTPVYPKFRKSCFDFIIAGSLLHHLIDITPTKSINKIFRSLHGFVRVLTKYGLLLIYEEPVLDSKIQSRTTYWFTRILSYVSNRIPIVFFLTIIDIENLTKKLEILDRITLISKSKSWYKERTGGFFLEKVYYKIINITYDVFIVFKKNES